MSEVTHAFERLAAAHRTMGSPLPEFFNPPALPAQLAKTSSMLGYPIPLQLADLYAMADGIDLDRWMATYGGVPAYLLPGWGFPSLSYARLRTEELTRIARSLSFSDAAEVELWRDDWLMVFTALTTGDEHIVAATDVEAGSLWTVRWEFEAPTRLGYEMAGLLDAAAARFRSLDARWDPVSRIIVWDDDLSDRLDSFP